MTYNPTLIDDTQPPTPPNHEESWHTIEDYRWMLERFTSPEWTLKAVEFEHNDHAGIRCSVLSATLFHPTGSIIRCIPFDPWGHHAGQKIYRRHRIKLQDATHDENYYVTLGDDAEELLDRGLLESLPENSSHQYPQIDDDCKYHRQQQVREADTKIKEVHQKFGCGYNAETIDEAVLAIFGATQFISRSHQRQTELGVYFSP